MSGDIRDEEFEEHESPELVDRTQDTVIESQNPPGLGLGKVPPGPPIVPLPKSVVGYPKARSQGLQLPGDLPTDPENPLGTYVYAPIVEKELKDLKAKYADLSGRYEKLCDGVEASQGQIDTLTQRAEESAKTEAELAALKADMASLLEFVEAKALKDKQQRKRDRQAALEEQAKRQSYEQKRVADPPTREPGKRPIKPATLLTQQETGSASKHKPDSGAVQEVSPMGLRLKLMLEKDQDTDEEEEQLHRQRLGLQRPPRGSEQAGSGHGAPPKGIQPRQEPTTAEVLGDMLLDPSNAGLLPHVGAFAHDAKGVLQGIMAHNPSYTREMAATSLMNVWGSDPQQKWRVDQLKEWVRSHKAFGRKRGDDGDDLDALSAGDIALRTGAYRPQISQQASRTLHDFTNKQCQQSWQSVKNSAVTEHTQILRGPDGTSFGLFSSELIQYFYEPERFLMGEQTLITRLHSVIQAENDEYQLLMKCLSRLLPRESIGLWDVQELVFDMPDIDKIHEVVCDLTAIYLVKKVKERHMSLGWFQYALKARPTKYPTLLPASACQYSVDTRVAKITGIEQEIIALQYDGSHASGVRPIVPTGPQGATTTTATAATPTPPPGPKTPKVPKPDAPRSQHTLFGLTDFPYKGAPYRRIRPVPQGSSGTCLNCWDPNAGHRAFECTKRCDRPQCRDKVTGEAAKDHTRKNCTAK